MGRRALFLILATTIAPSSLFGQRPVKAIAVPQNSPKPAESVEFELGYRPLLCAMHIHSQYSNGQFEILELAAHAHQRRVDVLGLTDSFLTKVRYGVGPFKKVMARSVSREGVLSRGIADYLSLIDSAQRRFPDVIVLPGLEVAPYYYWKGSYGSGLQLFNFDRHLLIFGLRDPRDIHHLPLIENETWFNTNRDWSTALGPGVVLISGFILIFLRRTRVVQLTHFVIRKSRSFRLLGAFLLVVGVLWGYDEYPFGQMCDPYSGKHDVQAYQRVVNYVRQRGGLSYWSYPEARYADISVGEARMISTSHPEDLGLVNDYNGFEGIYGGPITVTQPGNIWDLLLAEYQIGGRKSWPSVITGIDFHFLKKEGGWYELNRGQTVLWVKTKDEASVMDAMRHGRGYATFQGEEGGGLILRDYAVRSQGGVAIAGECLWVTSPVTLTASIEWDRPTRDLSATTARMEIVLDGHLAELREVALPIRSSRTDSLSPGKHYYRVRVKYGTTEILSNPIFVEAR